MKATFRKFGFAIAIIMMAISFVACSDDDDKEENQSIVGTWENKSGDSVETLIFGADGSYEREYMWDGEVTSEDYGTYTAANNIVTIERRYGVQSYGYKIKKNTLYLYEEVDCSDDPQHYKRQ